eukprot:1194946-Prorocentrum_minimum.AAC.4
MIASRLLVLIRRILYPLNTSTVHPKTRSSLHSAVVLEALFSLFHLTILPPLLPVGRALEEVSETHPPAPSEWDSPGRSPPTGEDGKGGGKGRRRTAQKRTAPPGVAASQAAGCPVSPAKPTLYNTSVVRPHPLILHITRPNSSRSSVRGQHLPWGSGGGQEGVRRGSGGGQEGIRRGSGGDQEGVRRGSGGGQEGVRG